jgi:hypothetical protein
MSTLGKLGEALMNLAVYFSQLPMNLQFSQSPHDFYRHFFSDVLSGRQRESGVGGAAQAMVPALCQAQFTFLGPRPPGAHPPGPATSLQLAPFSWEFRCLFHFLVNFLKPTALGFFMGVICIPAS